MIQTKFNETRFTTSDTSKAMGMFLADRLLKEWTEEVQDTDTRYLRYAPFGNDNIIRFPGVNNILIECNYRHDILERNLAAGRLPKALANRTKKSHCSFAECRATILAQDLSGVNNIVLIHLSDSNANAAEFQADIEAATGKTITVATPGLIIKNFSKTPF